MERFSIHMPKAFGAWGHYSHRDLAASVQFSYNGIWTNIRMVISNAFEAKYQNGTVSKRWPLASIKISSWRSLRNGLKRAPPLASNRWRPQACWWRLEPEIIMKQLARAGCLRLKTFGAIYNFGTASRYWSSVTKFDTSIYFTKIIPCVERCWYVVIKIKIILKPWGIHI